MKKITITALVAALCGLGLVGSATASSDDKYHFDLTPSYRYINVKGNEAKFREHNWMNDGSAGGVGDMHYTKKLDNDWKFTLEGHAIFGEKDYGAGFELVNPEVGFVNAHFSQYRKYYNDQGGFYQPFTPSSYSLNRDLFLEIRHFIIELGLTPADMPKITLGAEREDKEGITSLLAWGSVSQALPATMSPTGTQTRKIYPGTKDVDESHKKFWVNAEHTIKNFGLSNMFRYEDFRTKGRFVEKAALVSGVDPFGTITSSNRNITIAENFNQDFIANVFKVDSHFNDLLYASLGYMYQQGDGNAGGSVVYDLFLTTSNARNWQDQKTDVENDTHMVRLNMMVGPIKEALTIYGGIELEYTDIDGKTVFFRNHRTTTVSSLTTAIVSTQDNDRVRETLGIRFTKIPYTTVFAEAKWTQQDIDLYEKQDRTDIATLVTTNYMERLTKSDADKDQYMVGFSTSPIKDVNLFARYRHSVRDNNYNHVTDIESGSPNGYSAFITGQEFTTDEFLAKLTLRPMSQLSLAFQYQFVSTEVDTAYQALTGSVATPANSIESGDYRSHVYSLYATWSPVSRMYFTGLFSYQNTRTKGYNDLALSIQDYKGDVYTLIGGMGYAVDDKTDFRVDYLYSWADNFTNNGFSSTSGLPNNDFGLPLNLDFKRHALTIGLSRQLRDNVTASIGYGFYKYDEDSNGGIDDYKAHMVSVKANVRF